MILFPTKKRAITLLELCICIGLIALFSSLMGFKAYRLIEKHRFEKGVQRLQAQANFSHQMAITHQADIVFQISQKKNGLKFSVGLDEGDRSNQQLFEEGMIKDLHATIDGEVFKKHTLTFSSSGAVFPQGEVEFFSPKHENWKRTLKLIVR